MRLARKRDTSNLSEPQHKTAQAAFFFGIHFHTKLESQSREDLDTLCFGVTGFDACSLENRYNSFESNAAGLSRDRVLGKPLFNVVAPCSNNFMVAQLFDDVRCRALFWTSW